ncbi:nuclear transport factor 2 family protein [Myxococcota bacterium]|nr:nuclear transport factor 2 family protein [Myxococcota bacterium]
MPHITLEVTQDLIDRIDTGAAMADAHRILAGLGGVPMGACKSRVLVHDRWLAAEGADNPGFVHLSVQILPKNESWKRELGPELLGALRRSLRPLDDRIQVTVHLDDSIREDSYFKYPATGPFAKVAPQEANRRAILDAFEVKAETGSNQALIDLFAEEMVWTIHGSGALCRRYEGRDDFVHNCLEVLGERIEGRIHSEVEHCLAEGDTVVLLWKGRGRTVWGERYDNEYCWIFRFSSGKIVEGRAYIDTHLLDRTMRYPIS